MLRFILIGMIVLLGYLCVITFNSWDYMLSETKRMRATPTTTVVLCEDKFYSGVPVKYHKASSTIATTTKR